MESKDQPQCRMGILFTEALTKFHNLNNLPRLHLKYEEQYSQNNRRNQPITLSFPWVQVALRCALFLQVMLYPFAIKHLFLNLSNADLLPRYIALVCLLGLFRVLFRTQAIWLQFQLEVSVRKSLCKQISESAIYGDAHDNTATWNLINSDSHVAIGYFQSKQQLCFETAKLVFGIVYLYNTFNSAVFYGIGVVLIFTTTTSYASKKIVKLTDQLAGIKDSKFKIISLLLDRIREIKMCRLENYFNGKIKEVREQEFSNLRQRKLWDSVCVGAWQLTHVVLSFIVFSIYLLWYKGSINFEVESILYILEMLIMPLNGLPWYFSGLTKANQALERVNRFIQSHPRVQCKNITYNPELPPELTVSSPGSIPLLNLHVDPINLTEGNVYCFQADSKSGKSVFLKSLLGMFESNYQCSINGRIGYVDEKLFHLENSMGSIVSSLDLNPSMQDQEIRSLLVSFHCLQIPLENPTSTYSGGEKLRLALVRAFYQNNIIFVDSDLNSLDKKVKKYIEHQILLIAERMKKVVIITTNSPISKNTICIRNGRVFQSTHDSPNVYDTRIHQAYVDNYFSIHPLSLPPLFQSPSPASTSPQTQPPSQKLKLKHFLFYYKNLSQHLIFLISIIILFFLKNYYKYYINSNISDQDFIYKLSGITLLYILAVIFRSYCFAAANLTEAKRIGEKTLEVISFGNIEFYETHGKEALATRALSDMETVDSQFSFQINILFNNIFEMMFKMGVLVWSFLPMIVPVSIFMVDFSRNFFRYRRVSKFLEINSNRVNEKLLESVNILSEGKILIKGMKQEKRFLELFNLRLDEYINNKACINAQDRRFAQRFFLMTQALMLLALMITYFFRDSITSTDTDIKLAMTAMIGVTDYFGWLCKSVVTSENVSYVFKRQSDCIESVGHLNTERMSEAIKSQIKAEEGEECLRVEGLRFKYQEDGEEILTGLSLEMGKNDKVLIRGKTGSGKTTLFKILTGLYPQSSPQAQQFSKQFISFSPQKPLILPGNLKQNIDPYDIFPSQQLKPQLQKFSNKNINELTHTQQLLINVTRAEVYGRSSVAIYDEPIVVPEKGTQVIVSHHGEFKVDHEFQLLNGKLVPN